MAVLYCVKCRAKKDVGGNFQKVTMKNGKPAVKAKCPSCGTQMFKIGGA
jgi:RNase P subunit RPR2